MENFDPTKSIVTSFLSGDMNAFTKLYDHYRTALYHYGCNLTNDRELLKDCIQDVFIKIYNKRSELASVENFRAYLCVSLRNKLCDELRRSNFYSDTASDELTHLATDNLEESIIETERRNNEQQHLASMMHNLSPRQRKAVELYYIEEKDYEDICLQLNMNYQSARNLIHRSIKRLRELSYKYAMAN